MESTASEYFSSMLEEYDSLMRRAVPRYDEMLERLVTYLPATAERVLELGCGTGNLTLRLLERYPTARIVTIDAGTELLELTRQRAGPDAARLESRCQRFENLELADGSHDLVVSSISLHHVVDKGPVYQTLARALAPGGHFLFADELMGVDERVHAINWEAWLAFCRQDGGCTQEELRSLVEHAEAHDHFTSLAEHLRLLQEAGFVDLDCLWRNWIWGIVTGRKP
jgi:tRNA (cmo5U34)-methyltransferase